MTLFTIAVAVTLACIYLIGHDAVYRWLTRRKPAPLPSPETEPETEPETKRLPLPPMGARKRDCQREAQYQMVPNPETGVRWYAIWRECSASGDKKRVAANRCWKAWHAGARRRGEVR